jgi:hypothetical protein
MLPLVQKAFYHNLLNLHRPPRAFYNSLFGATSYHTAHDAFMTLSPYTGIREDVARRLGSVPNHRWMSFCVMKCLRSRT